MAIFVALEQSADTLYSGPKLDVKGAGMRKIIVTISILVSLTIGATAGLGAEGVRLDLSEYEISAVQVDRFTGTIKIKTQAEGPYGLIAQGTRARIGETDVSFFGNTLMIRRDFMAAETDGEGWTGDADDYPVIEIIAPMDISVSLIDFKGEADISDLNDRFLLTGGRSFVYVGDVRELEVDRWGSGLLEVGNVSGFAKIITKGSASLVMGDVATAEITRIGSGSIRIGKVHQSFDYSSEGSGTLDIDTVDGAVKLEVNGTGGVNIKQGRADPFHVTLSGSAKIIFAGEAVNPFLRKTKSGIIEMGSISGAVREAPGPVKIPLQWTDNLDETSE